MYRKVNINARLFPILVVIKCRTSGPVLSIIGTSSNFCPLRPALRIGASIMPSLSTGRPLTLSNSKPVAIATRVDSNLLWKTVRL
jgi:hypothetical protein